MVLWILLCTLATLVLGIVFWYYFTGKDIFEKYGVDYKKPASIFGNMLPAILQSKNLLEIVQDSYDLDKKAKYVGFYFFTKPIFLMRDEELVKSIAIKNFDYFVDHMGLKLVNEPIFETSLFNLQGEKWRKTRNILSPAFTSNKMRMMFQSIDSCAQEYGTYVLENLTNRDMIDSKDVFRRFTIDVIALYAFGLHVNSVKEPDNTFYRMGREVTNVGTIRFLLIALGQQNLSWLFNFLGLKVFSDRTVRFFHNIIENSIKERQEKNIYRPDMIQLMLESRDRDDGFQLSVEDMTAQAFIFFFGGFETTSNLICMIAYLLTVHPEVQKKLQREIDEVLEKHNGTLQYEHLQEFAYLEAVIQEVNRLHPPGGVVDRLCVKDFELPPAKPGLEPLPLKKGDCVWISIHSMHRDPRFFKDPEKFDPERFVLMNEEKNIPIVYIPFGIGPRACIGMRFALMEIKLLFIHILSRCDLVPCERTQYPIKLVNQGFSVVPEKGFWLSARSRKEKPATTRF